jgi:hypothetical protein
LRRADGGWLAVHLFPPKIISSRTFIWPAVSIGTARAYGGSRILDAWETLLQSSRLGSPAVLRSVEADRAAAKSASRCLMILAGVQGDPTAAEALETNEA